MIFQAYQTFQEYNQTDLAGLFTYAAKIVPLFTPLLLAAIFLIALLASFFSNKRITGKSDFMSSFAAASFFTTVVAFIMSLVDGLINVQTLVITVVVSIIATILLLINKD